MLRSDSETRRLVRFRQCLYGIALGAYILVQSGCDSVQLMTPRDTPASRALAKQLGYPGCRVSNPLDVEVAIKQARREGMDANASEQEELRNAVRTGSTIILVDCTAIGNQPLVEGMRFYAIVRDSKVQKIAFGQFLD